MSKRKIPKRTSVIVTLDGKTVYISITVATPRVVVVGMLQDAINMLSTAPWMVDPKDMSTQVAVSFLKDYKNPDDPDTPMEIPK